MSLEYRSLYTQHDPAGRAAYIHFTQQIHGLDLSRWSELGYWDDNYVSFSFFDGGRVVSSVSVYLLPMVVAGQVCRVPQLSGVGTDPAYRRRGLNRELTQRALAWCAEQGASPFCFFFADEDAFPFYARCGFRRATQHRFTAPVRSPHAQPPAPRRLDFDSADDRALLERLATNRAPASRAVGCTSANLLMFHALYTVRDCAYWLADLNVVVFARLREGVLYLADVVGPQLPAWSDLLPRLPGVDQARSIEFLFGPDLLQPPDLHSWPDDQDDGTHLGGSGFPLEREAFRFPFTARA